MGILRSVFELVVRADDKLGIILKMIQDRGPTAESKEAILAEFKKNIIQRYRRELITSISKENLAAAEVYWRAMSGVSADQAKADMEHEIKLFQEAVERRAKQIAAEQKEDA